MDCKTHQVTPRKTLRAVAAAASRATPAIRTGTMQRCQPAQDPESPARWSPLAQRPAGPATDSIPSAVPIAAPSAARSGHAPHEGTGDKAVARANQPQHVDDLRIRRDRGAGRQCDDHAGHTADQHQGQNRQRAQAACCINQRAAPLGVVVIDRPRGLGAQPQAQTLAVRAVRGFPDFDHARQRQGVQRQVRPSQTDSNSPCSSRS